MAQQEKTGLKNEIPTYDERLWMRYGNEWRITYNYHEIVILIEQAKSRVNAYANKELIDLYVSIGKYVSNKVDIDGWGRQTVKPLADFLSKNYPDVHGFSAQNIWRMKQFHETYKDDEKLSTLSRE